MAVWYIFFRVLSIVLGRSRAQENFSHVKVDRERERQQDKYGVAFFIVREGESGSRARALRVGGKRTNESSRIVVVVVEWKEKKQQQHSVIYRANGSFVRKVSHQSSTALCSSITT